MMDIPSFDVALSLKDQGLCEEKALEILANVKPNWKPEDVEFEVFTVGITNKIFAAYISEDEKVIFRVFGLNTEKVIDRDMELGSWAKLGKEGLAAEILAKFRNGLLCGYLKGKSLNLEQVRDPIIRKEICRSMAVMHNIPLNHPKDHGALSKMHQFLSNIKSFESDEKQTIYDNHFKNNLAAEIKELVTLIDDLKEEMAFCHNDLLIHNILYDEEQNNISFIDYEYADNNYALFDLANHFCEYSGVDNPDYRLCPSAAEKKEFLYNYLKFKTGYVDDERLTTMCQRIPLFEAASHLFWASWAVVQAQNSLIDFDYLDYAIIRHTQYRLRLDKYKKIIGILPN